MTPNINTTNEDRGYRHAKVGIFVFAVGVALALFLAYQNTPSETERLLAAHAQKQSELGNLPTRDELIKKTLGMTPDQVISAFGRPSRTDRYDKLDYAAWHYDMAFSYDPISRQRDEKLNIHFRGGQVDSLTF